jgi:hypothetical protein
VEHPVGNIIDWWLSNIFNDGMIAGSLISGRMATTIYLLLAVASALRQYQMKQGIGSMLTISTVCVIIITLLIFLLIIVTGGHSEGPGLLFVPIILLFTYFPLSILVSVLASLIFYLLNSLLTSERRNIKKE